MRVAATRSTLSRLLSRRMPPSMSERSAATLVNRSSTSSTGRPDSVRIASASCCAALASGPREPSSRFGNPTTILAASFSRAILAMREGSVAAGSAGIVVSACAMVADGSLNATPTRFEPGSMARMRNQAVEGRAGTAPCSTT